MNTAEVLERAADVIVERGWCQGQFENYATGRVCVDGALGIAERGDSAGGGTSGAWFAIKAHLKCNSLIDWNDTPGRTAAEVITALRDCAAAERAKQATP